MASSNDKLLDDAINEALAQQGFANGVARRLMRLLNSVDADLMAQITKAIESMPANSYRVQRLESLLSSVRQINDAIYTQVEDRLNTDLEDYTDYTVEHTQSVISAELPVSVALERVSSNQVYASAMARPFQGKLLREWFSKLKDDQMTAIKDIIAIGFAENETLGQIVKRIQGSKSLNYKDGVLFTKRRNVEAIARTAISHVASFSRNQVFEANANVIKGMKWVSVLDNRTTLICASRDGKVYPVGKAPAIPAHIGCRSSLVAVLKSWREMGLDIDEVSETTRSSLDGQIPSEVTYAEWLKTKPLDFQKKVLGETKAILFNKGDVQLDRFVNRSGYIYTIDELRKRDAEAFKKAGL